jgi:hypothetical protein
MCVNTHLQGPSDTQRKRSHLSDMPYGTVEQDRDADESTRLGGSTWSLSQWLFCSYASSDYPAVMPSTHTAHTVPFTDSQNGVFSNDTNL